MRAFTQALCGTLRKNYQSQTNFTMVAAGNLRAEEVAELSRHRATLACASGGVGIVEVRYRHKIQAEDRFRIEPALSRLRTAESAVMTCVARVTGSQ